MLKVACLMLILSGASLSQIQTPVRPGARQNKAEQELKELTAAVQRLAFEIRRVSDNESHEREKMALRLENTLLRFERSLPSARAEQAGSEQGTDQSL